MLLAAAMRIRMGRRASHRNRDMDLRTTEQMCELTKMIFDSQQRRMTEIVYASRRVLMLFKTQSALDGVDWSSYMTTMLDATSDMTASHRSRRRRRQTHSLSLSFSECMFAKKIMFFLHGVDNIDAKLQKS